MKNTQMHKVTEEQGWKEAVSQAASRIHMSEAGQARILEQIHREINQRTDNQEGSINMRRISGRKVMLAVAMAAVLVTGTAIGAGKIAGLHSGHNVQQIDFANAREAMASNKLGGKAKAVQVFADGTAFQAGYYEEVIATDAKGNKVGAYPGFQIMYQNGLTLSIDRPLDGVSEGNYPVVLTETYGEIPIKVTRMDYLFLPENKKPSEEDQKRMEEGMLEISYGTDQEERAVFLGASWEEDGLKYLLFTMEGGASEEELMAKAKEIIDVER